LGKRAWIRGSASSLYANNPHTRFTRLRCNRDASKESTAPKTHHDGVDIRNIIKNLKTDSPLPSNDV
jgi:hypothetical protein